MFQIILRIEITHGLISIYHGVSAFSSDIKSKHMKDSHFCYHIFRSLELLASLTQVFSLWLKEWLHGWKNLMIFLNLTRSNCPTLKYTLWVIPLVFQGLRLFRRALEWRFSSLLICRKTSLVCFVLVSYIVLCLLHSWLFTQLFSECCIWIIKYQFRPDLCSQKSCAVS